MSHFKSAGIIRLLSLCFLVDKDKMNVRTAGLKKPFKCKCIHIKINKRKFFKFHW